MGCNNYTMKQYMVTCQSICILAYEPTFDSGQLLNQRLWFQNYFSAGLYNDGDSKTAALLAKRLENTVDEDHASKLDSKADT